MGFLSLKHLTKKVVVQNYKLIDPIDNAIFKQFRRVTEQTNLGLVSRILEIDEFVAVISATEHPIGVITHLQLLDYISRGTKSCEEKSVTNGIYHMSV